MYIEIVGKNYDVSERLKGIIEKKLGKLDKYFYDEAVAKVVCREEKNGKKFMELTIRFGGRLVRSEVQGESMYDLIDLAEPKVERQLSKHKSKLEKKLKSADFERETVEPEREETLSVVKTKSFEIIPMDIDEAILQLDLLGHDFFVFLNADTGKIGVVYKRADGNVGLLNPIY
ncbi:MAG: ribosome hibernation-promoting factor, HPF/YfiA family [Christensenellales bacterium]